MKQRTRRFLEANGFVNAQTPQENQSRRNDTQEEAATPDRAQVVFLEDPVEDKRDKCRDDKAPIDRTVRLHVRQESKFATAEGNGPTASAKSMCCHPFFIPGSSVFSDAATEPAAVVLSVLGPLRDERCKSRTIFGTDSDTSLTALGKQVQTCCSMSKHTKKR